MGCSGPFGIIGQENPEKISFPLLNLDNKIQLKQKDGVNCGVIWCLFIYNLMQQALTPFDFKFNIKKKNLLPLTIGIGKTWIHPTVFSQYLSNDKDQLSNKNQLLQIIH